MHKLINKQIFSLVILGLMLGLILVTASPSSVKASIITTYSELFADEANNTNPSASWYTYAESHWAYSDVNGSDHFLINNSAASTAGCYANFTFPALATGHSAMDTSTYTQFYFEFGYQNNMLASNKRNHSGIDIRLKGSTYDVCHVYVYGLNATVVANRDRIVITNYSGAVKANHTAKTGFTYSVLYRMNYYSNTLTVTLTNETAGTLMNSTTMTLMGEDNILKFYMTASPSLARAYIFLDTLELTKSVPNYTAYNNIVQTIILVALPALLILSVMVLAITGNISTPEALVSLLVIILLAFVALSFIYS